ncbi:CBS domain-containing protein [Vallitalea pronyensis]|uniref:CBS domain-containing protein n=1 Tax=Vallitalea pronyensis TaxID=1348613 RepID=A0A8J8MJ00_9FIRM|nr:CBS domain-containing protein [Vallitalea pronyensis]QUI22459.1 CBS domain-containing protein [Vallitalea pronyensis]
MKAKEIMTSDIIAVTDDTSIKEAAMKMRDADVGSIPVEEDHKLVGILTDRDIVLKSVAEDLNANQAKCKDIMSKDVITVAPDMDVEQVVHLMSDNQVKRIPVVENHNLIGMISLKDVSQARSFEDEAGEVLNDITEDSFHTLS